MDKAKLFAKRIGTDEVEIPDIGTVRVRGLSREELLELPTDAGVPATERAMLALALVDPVLTEDEVAQWQAASPAGEMKPVVDKVNELSGIARNAGREAYKSV